jgi:hypothetical protein
MLTSLNNFARTAKAAPVGGDDHFACCDAHALLHTGVNRKNAQAGVPMM